MMRFTHKKTAAVAVTAVLALSGGGIAFAYFTAGGSGSGSANVGSAPTDAFSITSTGPSSPLLPGNPPQSFEVDVANTTGQAAYVGTVYMKVMTYQESGDAATAEGADIVGCTASWFSVTDSVDVDQVVPAHGSVSSTTPTIQMPAQSLNQDACKDASVGIAFTTTP